MHLNVPGVKIIPFTELAPTEWNAFVHRHQGSIHCTREWLAFISVFYRLSNHSFALVDNDRIHAIFPLLEIRSLRGRRFSTHIFSSYGEPCYKSPDAGLQQVCQSLVTEDDARIRTTLSQARKLGLASYFLHTEYQQRIDLSSFRDFEDYLQEMPKKRRNKIRRAGRRYATITSGTDDAHLNTFYQLQLETRKRLGLPTPKRAYYRRMLDALTPYDARIFLLHEGENPLASVLAYRNHHSLYYAAANSGHRSNSSENNEALIACLVIECIQNRISFLDLGGTPLGQDSLFRFKDHWRTENIALGYLAAPQHRKTSAGGLQALSTLYRHVPVGMARYLGDPLIRALK